MSRKCKAVVDSGAQVTVINKDCFKEYMRGKPSRPARLKGVAEDNSLMTKVVGAANKPKGMYGHRYKIM